MFQLPALCCKLLYNLAPLPYLLRAVHSEFHEMLPPELEVPKVPNKLNLTLNFRLCIFLKLTLVEFEKNSCVPPLLTQTK